MANPHKGEVAFEAGGKSYTLRYSIDAICALEEATGKGIVALSTELSAAGTISMGLLRQVVWAGLREQHPDVDLKCAGELIVDAGGLTKMIEYVGSALSRAFPQPEEPAAGAAARPPVPDQSGTGSA